MNNNQAPFGLVIEYLDTANMPDGQPLPPFIEDGAIWSVVRPLPGAHTRWRRIRIASGSFLTIPKSRGTA